ncbi:MAG TPA: energy transducer TonB [Sphingobium sp.]|nr:energy transducer TonB [Sphingobium sp.]
MTRPWPQRRWGPDRIASAIAALAVTGMIGYALVAGLRNAPLLRALADDVPLALFNLDPPVKEKPEPAPPVKQRATGREGGAPRAPAPLQVKNPDIPRPAPLVAPAPVIRLPDPVVPVGGSQVGTDEGVATGGTGGVGDGRGPGGSGYGAGGAGGDGGGFSEARQTGGRFRNSDFPETARGAGQLKIGVRYVIGPSGRVDKCEVIERSGYAEVDAMTCRVIEERYRFRPARDPEGYAVAEVREEDYRWRVP